MFLTVLSSFQTGLQSSNGDIPSYSFLIHIKPAMKPKKISLWEYSRQTTFRLIAGGILILFIIGDSLIYFNYGLAAAISGVLCLGVGLLPVLLIVGILWGLEYIVKKNSDS